MLLAFTVAIISDISIIQWPCSLRYTLSSSSLRRSSENHSSFTASSWKKVDFPAPCPAALPAAVRLQQRHGRDGQRQQHGAFQLQLRTRMLRLVQRQLQLRQQQQLIRFPDSPAPSVRVIWESLNEKSRIRVKPGAVFIMILLLLRSRFYPSSNEAGSGASSLAAD